MSCLAQTMANASNSYDANMDSDDRVAQKKAINEIERYKHIDEWIASFQNIYSITALDCLVKLSSANLVKLKLVDFLHYTRPGNADPLRLKAFECLLRLTDLKNDAVLRYFLYNVSHDPSPYMRNQIWHILGKGLGRVAIGEQRVEESLDAMNGLIVEQEGSTEIRQAEFARKRTIPGALAALKQELGASTVLEEAIWSAVKYFVLFFGFNSFLTNSTDPQSPLPSKCQDFWICALYSTSLEGQAWSSSLTILATGGYNIKVAECSSFLIHLESARPLFLHGSKLRSQCFPRKHPSSSHQRSHYRHQRKSNSLRYSDCQVLILPQMDTSKSPPDMQLIVPRELLSAAHQSLPPLLHKYHSVSLPVHRTLF